MPEWLLIVLSLLANLLLAFFLQRGAYHRGYAAGIDDSLEISRQVDDILRDDRRLPPVPPPPPTRDVSI